MDKEKEMTEIHEVLHALPLLAQGRASITLAQILPAMQDAETGVTVSQGLPAVLSYLIQQTSALKKDGLDTVEDVLLSQLLVMDALFHKSVLAAHVSPSVDHHNIHMNLAFKAQAQTRSTAEAIAAIRNPRTYIHQQNMAYRPQVNNGTVVQNFGPESPENSKSTNELLSTQGENDEKMDFGRASTPSREDQGLVALEVVNGADDHSRKVCFKNERSKTRATKRRHKNAA